MVQFGNRSKPKQTEYDLVLVWCIKSEVVFVFSLRIKKKREVDSYNPVDRWWIFLIKLNEHDLIDKNPINSIPLEIYYIKKRIISQY